MASATLELKSIEQQKRNILQQLATFPVAVSFMLAVGVFATTRSMLAEPDIFWHLRNAAYVVSHHRVVSQDMYSFTVGGTPWVSHEWLSELAYYGAYRAFGWQGVLGLYCGLMMAIVLGVYWLARREGADPLVAGLAAAIGKMLIGVGSGPRMQHFGWLCFIAVYAILQKYRSERRGPLWVLPLLFCLWINLHGSWASGAAVCVLLVLSALLPRDFGRVEASPWTWRELRPALFYGFLSCIALFINPTGYKAILYPFETMIHMPLQQQFVQEWQPASMSGPIGLRIMIALALLFVIAVLGKKKWRIDEVVLTVFVLYFGLMHERLLVLAGIVLPPILARHVISLSSYDPSRERRGVNLGVCCASVIAIVLLFPSKTTLQSDINADYPAGAAAFMHSHPLQGRLFNTYQWGGYLEWTMPDVKTFIDGRGDVFEYRGVLKDYLDVVALRGSKEILDRYQIDYVLFASDSELAYLLSNTSGWRETYHDKQSAIFEKIGTSTTK